MNRELKTWRVRFHMNTFDIFRYREMTVDAYDRAHALTVAAMATTNEEWTGHVKRSTASVIADPRFQPAKWLAAK